jgi:hypothetical protein
LPVFRSADALSQPFLVEPRAKQEDSADLAKQAGLRLRALHVRLDHITPKRFGLLYATFNATLILSSLLGEAAVAKDGSPNKTNDVTMTVLSTRCLIIFRSN